MARILLAEDDASTRDMVQRALAMDGHDVVVTQDGAEALEKPQAAPDRIDLLISDVVMPETYGTDLIRQARALRPGLPALLISGFADLQNARHDPIPEGVPFLPKPFDLVDLLAQVRALLGG